MTVEMVIRQGPQPIPGYAFVSDAGEALPEADYHLNFASAAQLFSELTPAGLILLKALKRARPHSIYALAKPLRASPLDHAPFGRLGPAFA